MAIGGKITNWSFDQEFSQGKLWTHDILNRDVSVSKPRNHYLVKLHKTNDDRTKADSGEILAEAKTKRKAHRLAAKWMRDHPLAGRDPDEVRQEMDL
jgi:hypothetical protein